MSWIEDPGTTYFCGLNISSLGLDEAFLNVSSMIKEDVWIYELSSDCHKCPFERNSVLESRSSQSFIVNTKFPWKYRITTTDSGQYLNEFDDRHKFCEVEQAFGEFGVYNLEIARSQKDKPSCFVKAALEPVNIYRPLLLVFLFYLLIGCLVYLVSIGFRTRTSSSGSSKTSNTYVNSTSGSHPRLNYVQGKVNRSSDDVHKYGHKIRNEETTHLHYVLNPSQSTHFSRTTVASTICSHNSDTETKVEQAGKRFKSIDAFRGLCIIVMIFVNDGGAGYYFMDHATWDGLYVADLVNPWFLWIMGLCIPISIKHQVERKNSRWTIFKKIFIRSCKLILIGIFLGSEYGQIDIKTIRLPGILQRFGMCYFVCCTLLLFPFKINFSKAKRKKFRAAFQDVEIIWTGWVFVIALVLLHYMLTFCLVVPGCPTGYLGPGGLHGFIYKPKQSLPSHCVGGAAGYIDRIVLTPKHIYQWPADTPIYKADPFDSDGILGTLTAIFQVFSGVQIGVTMLVYPSSGSRIKRYLAWALISGALGSLLHFTGWVTVNRPLWSISYVFVTNCFAILLFTSLYFLIDLKSWYSGSPFFEPGMNSILLYVGHSVAHSWYPWHFTYGTMRTHFSRLIESCWGTTLWVLISIYLYKKRKICKL